MDQASTRKEPESCWDAWNWVCGFEVAVGSIYLFSLWWVLLYWMRTHLPCQRLTFSLRTSVLFREDTLSVDKGFTNWRNSFFITTSFVPQKNEGLLSSMLFIQTGQGQPCLAVWLMDLKKALNVKSSVSRIKPLLCWVYILLGKECCTNCSDADNPLCL